MCVCVTSLPEDSIEEELQYDEAFESYDSFVTEGSVGRCTPSHLQNYELFYMNLFFAFKPNALQG
jgi:hypothetical protein